MKLTIFALIAALCLATVNADIYSDSIEIIDDDFEYIAQDLAEEVMEIEPRGAFSFMYFVFKRALRTLKGLNCTIKEVLAIQSATQNFVNNVNICGVEVTKKVATLIKACNDILKTCEEILGINESVCGNTNNDDDSTVQSMGVISNAKTTHKCAVKMLRKFQTLNKQIKYAVKLIKQIKKVPGDTSECVMNAVSTLENRILQFPNNIKVCSKLTSK